MFPICFLIKHRQDCVGKSLWKLAWTNFHVFWDLAIKRVFFANLLNSIFTTNYEFFNSLPQHGYMREKERKLQEQFESLNSKRDNSQQK